VLPSAHRHGCSDEDIAIRNRIATHELDGYLMIVGPTFAGELIEVATNQLDQVFHAMRARRRFLP